MNKNQIDALMSNKEEFEKVATIVDKPVTAKG